MRRPINVATSPVCILTSRNECFRRRNACFLGYCLHSFTSLLPIGNVGLKLFFTYPINSSAGQESSPQ
ncbi:hypothetical protein NQ315_001163 [Exocentrus adspersus]|uniref:Uncharacterized protein n=1 Tax=Exocentrus adspersus TaxID=1586481 RepID=A0AAV8WEL2_9CUCU|nr:hypothetical protein NQ315_001163 [Exocentrus adspersus]